MKKVTTGLFCLLVSSSKSTALHATSFVDFDGCSSCGFDKYATTSGKMLEARGGSCPEEGVDENQSPALEDDDDEEKVFAILDEPDIKDGDDDDNVSSAESCTETTELRQAGKEAHDNGDFALASEFFQKAADSLKENSESLPCNEYATYRLHQALCDLKAEKYNECLVTCSDILDGNALFTSVVRARAYHRRAKAKLGINDQAGALQDARSAAFLGDQRGVALYGRLMRGSTLAKNASSTVDGLTSHQSSPSAALFESLMSKSLLNGQPDLNPSLQFGGMDGIIKSLGGSDTGGAGLAKSVIKSLSKRLDDENTQISISTFLQRTDKTQLQHFALMAGFDVPDTYLDRIENMCHRITPKTVKRTVTTTRCAIYFARIVRRAYKLAQKYKTLLVALVLLQWTKSAILRPMPVDHVAARRHAKELLKDAMKANRDGGKLPV